MRLFWMLACLVCFSSVAAAEPTLCSSLHPMSSAPHDGTPIVVVMPITDEGDFLMSVFWIEGWGWNSTASETYDDEDFLGWVGAADDIFNALAEDK